MMGCIDLEGMGFVADKILGRCLKRGDSMI